ncbi:ATP-binding protein [Pyrobaculum aerophilum]|uniref:AAA family ATPase n=2 Tax=Pyrobaculum aerophilum TaxID=13773 RepID=A0A371QYU1_9CREN|nr:ATP-binding protein [Pyrobaculum aerophilum]RFA95998.1 AAA family ATPase [Pyrobaculum aerophilum]
MKPGEELDLIELDKLDMGEDFKIILSRVLNGSNVYIVGPPGSGKTAMLRKLGLYLSRAGKDVAYVKLEWVKYGWDLGEYIKHYGVKIREFVGNDGGMHSAIVLLDDGELLWSYSSAYKNLIRDIRGRQIIAAFREFDADTATLLFGDGFIMYLQRKTATKPLVKTPLGLGFIGKTAEVVVI